MQHAWKLYRMIIYSLSIHCYDMFYVTWRGDRKSIPKQSCPQCTDLLSRLRMLETPQFWQVPSQHFVFYGCSMIIPKPICFEDMANFLYDLGFLGLWMHGYATVSYNQILNHLRLWPTLTAVGTAVLKVKLFKINEDELTFVWSNYELSVPSDTDSKPRTKIKTSLQIRSIFGGTQLCMCISKNKTQLTVQMCTIS